MKCEEFVEYIKTDYLDNELSADLLDAVSEHIKTCVTCKELYEQLQETMTPFKTAKPLNPPETLWPEIEKRFHREIRQSRKILFFSPKILVAAATVLIAVSIGFYSFFAINRKQSGSQEFLGDQVEFLMSLQSDEDMDNGDEEYYTVIEKYFS